MENDRGYSERIPFASKSDSQIHPMSCVLQTQLHPDELVMRNEAIVVIDEDMTENIDNKNDDKVKKAPPGNLSLEEKIANVSDWFSKTFTTCDIGKKRFVANLKEMIGNNKNFKLTYFLTDVDKSEKGMYICGPVDLNEKMAKKISSKEDTALQMHLTKSNTLSDLDAIIKNDIEGLENKEKCAERKSGSLLSDVCVFKVSIPVSQSTEFKMSAQKNTMIDHQKVLEMFHHDCSNFLSNMKLELQHKFKIECPFCAELCENERLFTALTEYERHFRHVHTSKINVGGHLSRYIYYDTLELFEAKNLWIDNPCSSTLPQVFVCYVCKYATTKRYSYYSHLLRHRNVATFYVCYQCKTSFHSYPTLFSHYESEHDIKVICPNPPSFTVELPEDATMHPDGTSKDFISGPTFRRNIMKKKEVHELLETMVMKHPTMEVFLENADKMSPQYKEKFYEVKNSIWKILTKTKVQLFHDAKTNLRAKQLLQLREKCDSNAEKMKVTQVTCLVCHVVFKTQFDKITHHFDEHVFAHISRNEKDRLKKVLDEPLRCGNCNEKLRSKFDLYIHQYSEHNDKNVHVLNHSPDRLSVLGKRKVTISQKRHEFLKRFGHTNDIRLWIKYLPEELIYCDKCDKKFVPSNYTGFVKHQVQAHGIVMPYNCHRCGKGFDNEAVFNKHRCKKKPNGGKICKQAANVTQTTEGKVCERCGKVVKTEVGLKCHLKSCGLSGKAIHTCPRCSKTFGLFAVYKEHVVNVNCTNDSNFEPVDEFVSGNTIRLKQCSRCDRRFTNTADYKQHMDTVNCNNDPKFRQGHRRKRKPYIDFCPRCSKRFHSSRGLTRHLKTVNCTDDPAFVPVPTKEVQVARHCPRCGKNIYSEMIYKRHVNIVNCTNAPDFVPRFDHTAAFNFKWDCPKCGKSFTKRISARDHRNKVNCLKDPNFIPRRPSSQITQCRQILKSPAEDRQNKTSSLNEGTKTGENVSTSLTAKQFGNNYSNLDVCTSNVDNLDAVNVDTMTTIDGSNTPSARLNFFRETDFGQDMLADVATDVSCSLPTSAVISLHSEQDKCISANVQQSNASTPVSQIFKTSNIQASETKHSVAQHFHSKEVSSSYGIATCNVEPSTLYGANSVGNIPMSEAELQSSSNPVSTCDIVPTSIMSVDNMLMNQAELEASTQSIDNASRYTKLEFSSVFTEGSEIIVPPGFSLVQGEDEQFYLIPLDIAQEN